MSFRHTIVQYLWPTALVMEKLYALKSEDPVVCKQHCYLSITNKWPLNIQAVCSSGSYLTQN